MTENQQQFKKQSPDKDLVTQVEAAVARYPEVETLPATVGPMEIMMAAVQRGAGVEELAILKETYQWQKEVKADFAKEAYHKAFAAFKADPPEILKTAHVRYQKKDSTWTEYDHADLGEICEAISERMAKYGLYPRWDQKRVEGGIEVPCIITHELGHFEIYGPIFGAADSSGGKNPIQSVSSTNTYLQRISLLGATGLAAKGMDNDGNTPSEQPDFITESQVKSITKRMKKVYEDDGVRFLAWLEVETVDTILAGDYKKAIGGLTSAEKALDAKTSQREPGDE